jgi:hypothetical protein
MKCWHCNSELIWGSDNDLSEDLPEEDIVYDMVTYLTCSSCESSIEVYRKKNPKLKLVSNVILPPDVASYDDEEGVLHDSEGC